MRNNDYFLLIADFLLNKGLTFNPDNIYIEEVNLEQLIKIVARDGFPKRFTHWTWGRNELFFEKTIRSGTQNFAEIALWSDPYVIYLSRLLPPTFKKVVLAHALTHIDFFENNLHFKRIKSMAKNVIDRFATHKIKVDEMIERYGIERVENFLDRALSIRNLIDPNSLYKKEPKVVQQDTQDIVPAKLPVPRPYLDPYINPPPSQIIKNKSADDILKFPKNPVRDILLFLIKYAPLEDWEAMILTIIRDEEYYFVPIKMTNILNEGWAAYWHSIAMTNLLDWKEIIDYCEIDSRVVVKPNPYWLGRELFRNIEENWNKGRFGKEYEECDDLKMRENYDRKLNIGREKIFEVRTVACDVTFIYNYLNEDFLIKYSLAEDEESALKLKERILLLRENLGEPVIEVIDANYNNANILYLIHRHNSLDLKRDYMRAVLSNLYTIWKRPVILETKLEGKTFKLKADKKGVNQI